MAAQIRQTVHGYQWCPCTVSRISRELQLIGSLLAAASFTCKELTFVRNILNDLGHPLAGPIVIGVDNEAAIKICENQGVTARNKHFQDSIHYFRDMNARNYVVPTFVRTDVQHADGFTKPLARPQFLPWAERFVRP